VAALAKPPKRNRPDALAPRRLDFADDVLLPGQERSTDSGKQARTQSLWGFGDTPMPATDHSNRLPALAAEIRAAHDDVRRSALATAERALAAGKALTEAKAALPHGAWQAWLKANTGLSTRTARRYTQIAASGFEMATVANLGVRAASEAIAPWPLPEPAMAIRLVSTRPFEGKLQAVIWHAEAGFFDIWAFNSLGEFGGCVVSQRPVPVAQVAGALRTLGLRRSAICIETFPFPSLAEASVNIDAAP